MNLPLVFTDELLFSGQEPNAKVVLAATLGVPNRDPSLSQLAEMTGLKRNTVKAAQDELERWRTMWLEVAEEMKLCLPGVLVVYDKPEQWYDRYRDNPRFNRSNKVTSVWLAFDPTPSRASDAPPRIELPAHIHTRLPRRSRSAAVLRLVAAVYAREQLRRGAIQIEDETVARKLGLKEVVGGWEEGPNVRQVARARETLIAAGILVVHDADAQPCPIYTMPGATPQRVENPAALEPEWTFRFRRHRLKDAGEQLDVYATDAQWATVLTLVRHLGDVEAVDAIFDAGLDPLDDNEAEKVIDALARACPPSVRNTYLRTTRHLSADDEIPIADISWPR